MNVEYGKKCLIVLKLSHTFVKEQSCKCVNLQCLQVRALADENAIGHM